MSRYYLLLILLPLLSYSQNRITTGQVSELYKTHCMSCHGSDLQGGLGGNLLDKDAYKQVGQTTSFLEYVRGGNKEMGMPAFKDGLTDPQIRALEIYIDEVRQKTERAEKPPVQVVDGVYTAGGYSFKLKPVVEGLSLPWSVDFLPNEGYLITERGGSLRQFIDGQLLEPVEGTPDVYARGQGGLLEVALHPEYADNAWIYLAYSHESDLEGKNDEAMTRVVRGRIVENTWQDEELIYEAPQELYRRSGVHYGTRLVFQEGFLFFSIGDRGAKKQAQDLSRPNGKIHRIHDDGRIPAENPFADTEDALPSIWTYGHRNPQGLDAHPVTGEIWESEHGPRGGDEINLIQRGVNYGWPVITYGMNYSGTPMTDKTSAPGMEQPKLHWTPSIAVCGMDFYEGDVFPAWQNNLLVGGLASQELHRLVIQEGEIVTDEIILNDAGRVRDVASGPDGSIYLVLNGPDVLARLVRVDE